MTRQTIMITNLIVAGNGVSGQPTGVVGYEATSIGTLPGHPSSDADGLDEYGRLVGYSRELSGLTHGVVWINGELIEIPPPPGAEGANAFAISPSTGVIVGSTELNGVVRPGVWIIGRGSGVLENISGGELTPCYGTAVNDSGWIAGDCFSNLSVLWVRRQPPIDLGGLGSHGSQYASDINELGEIVGDSYNHQNVRRPYLWRDGEMFDIGVKPQGNTAWAWGVNDDTSIVGGVQVFGAFVWRDGEQVSLPSLGPCGALPYEINGRGLIVGESNLDPRCANGRESAVVWEEVTAGAYAIFDLNALIPHNPDLKLVAGRDINNAGQIAAYGEDENGENGRGYLVTPYQFELSDPAPGVAGERNMITVSGLTPDQQVYLVWGTQPGAQPISQTCPGGTLLIRDPRHTIAPVRADANGVATFNIMVPRQAQGANVRYQAISRSTCEISHTVDWVF